MNTFFVVHVSLSVKFLQKILLTPFIFFTGPCPPGWERFGTKCYLFMADHPQSWDDASNMCQEQNGHLLEIKSSEENDFVRDVLQDLPGNSIAWLACSDREEEGTWVCRDQQHSWKLGVRPDASTGFFSKRSFTLG